ncbi:SCO family protein [Actibacterium sp. XHP0104]|uniref:SCO family protein n=1 Tax=Actibacterium sp. XHP0104 TaxID=2984335 RepID=UPI0021E8F55F|nr:SCO family protein [Actibacterium sp. XHP0104]MCV2882126.1 SCO family protein [Actibacterium sp. XHP0104]
MTRTYAILAAIVAVAFLVGSYAWTALKAPADKYAECRGGQVAGGTSTIGGPFTLVDENGVTVTDADVITGPTLLYFGYTFCPDVCPADNARNAEAVDLLDAMGKTVNPIFISIDPERDTPEQMKEFTDYMHPRMLGLTGSPEQVKAASQAYRTYFKKEEGGDPEYYLVDHSTFTYLVFPQEGFVEFFRRDDSPQQMADRVACFMDAQ